MSFLTPVYADFWRDPMFDDWDIHILSHPVNRPEQGGDAQAHPQTADRSGRSPANPQTNGRPEVISDKTKRPNSNNAGATPTRVMSREQLLHPYFNPYHAPTPASTPTGHSPDAPPLPPLHGNSRGSLVTVPRTPSQAMSLADIFGLNPSRSVARGVWDWEQALSEPLTLGLDDCGNHYAMELRRPAGLHAKDLTLEVHEDVLTIKGEHKKTTKADNGGVSTSSSSFSRSIRVPSNVNLAGITAKYVDAGQRLHIELPKLAEDRYAPKRINIAGADTVTDDKDKMSARYHDCTTVSVNVSGTKSPSASEKKSSSSSDVTMKDGENPHKSSAEEERKVNK